MVPGFGELHQRLVTRFPLQDSDSMYRTGIMVPGPGELPERLVTRFVIRCIGQGSWFPDLGSCIKG